MQEKNINLAKWGKAYAWNEKQGREMEYYPINPQCQRDGREILPAWRTEDTQKWQIGYEWEEPREVSGAEIIFADSSSIPDLENIRIEYWNTSWPTPMLERWQGARSAWNEMEDPRRGSWIRARGEMKQEGLRLVFAFDPLDITEIDNDRRIEWAEEYNAEYRQTLKIRFVVQGDIEPVVTSFNIWGTASFEEASAQIRFGCDKQEADWSGSLKILNGELLEISPLDFEAQDSITADGSWVCHTHESPKGIRVRFLVAKGSRAQADQTFLCVKSNANSFTVLASDIEKGPVWIKDYGVLVSRILKETSWEEELKHLPKGFKSIYDEVEREPEQSYERAAKEIPPLDVTKQAPYGRYAILGWEGILQKFALRYNGEIFAHKRQVKMAGRDASKVRWAGNEIHFRFASGNPVDFRQHTGASSQKMMEPQIPVYVTQWEDREIEFTQTAFGALVDGAVKGPDAISGQEELLAMVRIKIRNTTQDSKKATLVLDITPAEELTIKGENVLALGRVVPSEAVKDGWKVQAYPQERYRLRIDTKKKGCLKTQPLSEGGVLTSSQEIDHGHFIHFGEAAKVKPMTTSIPNALAYEIELPEYESHEIDLLIPFSTYGLQEAEEKLQSVTFEGKLEEVKAHWNNFYQEGAKIEIPDKILNDFAKAVPWHILMTANKDSVSGNYMVPAGTYAYDVCGNEACMQTRFLDTLGHHQYAERYLDTFLETQGVQMPDGNFQSQEGAFVAVSFDSGETQLGIFGYNLDHGFIMSAFAEHYFMTENKQWLWKVSPNLISACDFVIREKKATMITDEKGEKTAEYGLLPMGHLEDNSEWRYWFAVNAQAFGGMYRIAKALTDIKHPEAPRIAREAEDYKQDIQRALQKAIEESPVVKMPDGSYIPHIPARVGAKGRDWGWFREVGYGALHLVDGLVLEPNDKIVTWILKDQEDNLFTSRRYGRAVDLEKYWFSRGGVTVQANVLNNGVAYLARGQISHAIRSLYNNVGQHLYPDILVFSEHPVAELGSGFGPFFKTPDEAQFLIGLRTHLVREEGNNLWICPGAPLKWYEENQRIHAEEMVTAFGKLGFTIESKENSAQVQITMPDRKMPNEIYLRVCNAKGNKIKKVMLNGREYSNVNQEKSIVILAGNYKEAKLEIQF